MDNQRQINNMVTLWIIRDMENWKQINNMEERWRIRNRLIIWKKHGELETD